MNQELINQFKAISGANSRQAQDYLQRAGGNVDVAVNLWFDSGEQPLPEDVAPKKVAQTGGSSTTQACGGLLEFVLGDVAVPVYTQDAPLSLQNWTGDHQIKIGDKDNSVTVSGYYNWGSVRAGAKVFKGRWYYEVNIQSSGQMRIGWAAENYRPAGANEDAVGSSDDSWGWDGSNKQIFHDPNNKNNRGINGVTYGDYWATGDTIGCFLDFDLREIKYSRNGRLLAVAFQNVNTFNPLIPCVSLKRGVKCTINLGPNFKYDVASYYGLSPTCSNEKRKQLIQIFESYCKKGIKLSDSMSLDLMSPAAFQALVTDLGGVKMTDPHFLLLCWRLRPKDFLQVHLNEWILLWANEKIYTLDEMKTAVIRWNKEVKADENVFLSFYSFVFDYMRLEKGERNTVLEKNDAKACWEVLDIRSRFKFYDDWIQYCTDGPFKGINKDTWMMLLTFIKKHGNSLKTFDANDCWPAVIEDFVLDVLQPKYGK